MRSGNATERNAKEGTKSFDDHAGICEHDDRRTHRFICMRNRSIQLTSFFFS
jgi:hypothetical protein